VYFSMLGPASYGFGTNSEDELSASIAALSVNDDLDDDDNDMGALRKHEDDYETKLIIDCYGRERLEEYYGKNMLSLVLVCAIDEGILSPAPGGRTNALVMGVRGSSFLSFLSFF
jgi:hypothetical protein